VSLVASKLKAFISSITAYLFLAQSS